MFIPKIIFNKQSLKVYKSELNPFCYIQTSLFQKNSGKQTKKKKQEKSLIDNYLQLYVIITPQVETYFGKIF